VDSELGRLTDALRADGRLGQILFVVTSDHGESLGEHGEAFHSYTLYDATLAVPLILRGPGIPPGRVVGGVVSVVDVAPTLLARLGLAALPDADGPDLSPLWQTDSDPPSGAAYAETLATEIDHGWSPLFAIRSPHHRYVRAPRPELYATSEDPAELRNLLDGEPESASPVATDLARRIDAVLVRERRREPEAIDAETRSRLAALGYAVPARPTARSGLDPKDGLSWMPHYDEAHRAVEAHELERARGLLEEMLKAVPASVLAHSLLARVHILEGRPDRALASASAAVRLRPDGAGELALLGDVKAHLGDRAGAGAAYRAAAVRDSQDPQVQVGLMWAEAQEGDLRRAGVHVRRALELSPTATELRHRIGSVWERVGEYERALEAYRGALELNPDSEQPHMELAIQTARLGRDDEAQAHLRRAGALARTPQLRNRLAIVYAARGEAARAEAIFRDLIRRYPDYESARRNLALLLHRSGRGGESGP
jgi:Flp pilus assembly protein TadD